MIVDAKDAAAATGHSGERGDYIYGLSQGLHYAMHAQADGKGSPQHLDERKTYLDWQLVECHSRHLADLAAWRTVGSCAHSFHLNRLSIRTAPGSSVLASMG